MLSKGDFLVAKKDVKGFLEEGEVVKILDVKNNGMFYFGFGEDFAHKGLMSISKYNEYFGKLSEVENDTDLEDEDYLYMNNQISFLSDCVEDIMVNSEITVQTVFGKCTIVSCKLPNGCVIVEYEDWMFPEKYDEETGVDICLDKIADKIWELESYKLQDKKDYIVCTEDCDECEEYDCPENPSYYS